MLEAVATTNVKGVSTFSPARFPVRLTKLRLSGYRNLASTTLDVPPEGVVLVGRNGQGKTNLLEAIHYLALFRSFRRTRHADAIAFDSDRFRVEGTIATDEGRKRTVAVSVDGGQRRIAVDGAVNVKPTDAVGVALVALLSPDDLSLVAGSPSERRGFLDTLLGITSTAYRRGLQTFDRALRQRNELLKKGNDVDPNTLEPWDEALVSAGSPLVAARGSLVTRLSPRFGAIGSRLAGDGDDTRWTLRYRPSVPVGDEEVEDPTRIADAWRDALADRRDRDLRRGWTTVGPHRDDLDVRRGGRPVSRYGSQGERRTAAIALRLIEAEILETDTGRRPILLLDDVFSELDAGRAERLLEWLGDERQRFVTSPRPLPALERTLPTWEVEAGVIETEPSRTAVEVA